MPSISEETCYEVWKTIDNAADGDRIELDGATRKGSSIFIECREGRFRAYINQSTGTELFTIWETRWLTRRGLKAKIKRELV